MFILASKSPRRAELLKKIYNKEFIIDPTDADESKIKNIDPSDTSLAIALLKMNEAIKKHPNDTILTADTIVIQNGTIYGKPKTKVDAINMLNNLGGVPHQVITGYAIAINGKIVAQNKTVTNLTLKRMSSNEIENYIATGSPFDKAGGYGIQDTEYIIQFFINLLFYATPILYEATLLPERIRWVLYLNPLTHLIETYRDLFM